MIEVAHMKCIQICITHRCPFRCSNCSQCVPHVRKPHTMTLDEIEKALDSLIDFPGHIGMFGGEPAAHPQFREVCELYKKYVPVKTRRGLWTAGYKWDEYKDLILDTFYPEQISYNEHWQYQPCWHQPIHIAIDEVIVNPNIRARIIDNCWVQNRWSASIVPKGAYFCEVAAGRAMMLGYPKGLEVKRGWWKRPLRNFRYQRKALCGKCSACLPMPMIANDKQEYDDCSEGMGPYLNKYKAYDIEGLKEYYQGHTFTPETDYLKRGGFKDFPDWHPWRYREKIRHGPDE